MSGLVEIAEKSSTEITDSENGTLFVHEDKSTYPPEFSFVVLNVLPNVPVYYDRNQNTWWTAIADNGGGDIYSRDDLYHDDGEYDIYWQPIEFKKSDVLFILAEKAKKPKS
jgi:hypothetical protein